jgi:hypothetical protein
VSPVGASEGFHAGVDAGVEFVLTIARPGHRNDAVLFDTVEFSARVLRQVNAVLGLPLVADLAIRRFLDGYVSGNKQNAEEWSQERRPSRHGLSSSQRHIHGDKLKRRDPPVRQPDRWVQSARNGGGSAAPFSPRLSSSCRSP